MKKKVPRCFEMSKTTGSKTRRHNGRLVSLIPSEVHLLLDLARILSQKQEFKIINFPCSKICKNMCKNKHSVIRHNYKQRVVNIVNVSALLCHLPSLKKGREEPKYVGYHKLLIIVSNYSAVVGIYTGIYMCIW